MRAMDSPCYNLPPLLAGIHSPEDVKALAADQLPQLAEEVRTTLIETLPTRAGTWRPTWVLWN